MLLKLSEELSRMSSVELKAKFEKLSAEEHGNVQQSILLRMVSAEIAERSNDYAFAFGSC